MRVAILYSCGEKDEAEELFVQVQKGKLNMMCQALADIIYKSDRAMAMGDYKTVETHTLKRLEQTFPKLDKLTQVTLHHQLGAVYEKCQEYEKAMPHYRYCANFGGETAIKTSARAALERIQGLV